jgi:catalase
VNSYSQDGAARHGFKPADAPVYAPNSFGGPSAQPQRAGEGSWESDGDLVRSAATLHAEDDDFGQAGTLYREVFDDDARARFLDTVSGAVSGVRREDIRERAIQYWTNVDATLGRDLRARLESGGETPDQAAEYVGVAE